MIGRGVGQALHHMIQVPEPDYKDLFTGHQKLPQNLVHLSHSPTSHLGVGRSLAAMLGL